jgi:hypothetical protein
VPSASLISVLCSRRAQSGFEFGEGKFGFGRVVRRGLGCGRGDLVVF